MTKGNLTDPIAVRIPVDVLEDVQKIAETCGRPRSWVMVRALRHYLAREGADILAVRQGREQVAQGDVCDVDDVLQEIDEIIAPKAL